VSSFLHSAAVLQQTLPSHDIMRLLRNALGSGEADVFANLSNAPPRQPSLTPRHMSTGLRQAHMQQYMRQTAQHPHVCLAVFFVKFWQLCSCCSSHSCAARAVFVLRLSHQCITLC
jgi:hypothetical protein